MARALRLAEQGLWTTDPNPRVGCVLAKEGQIVGEGWHQRAGEAHAEIHALNAAGAQAKGATCYVSLEPCCHFGRTPPCSQALINAGVARVVAAMPDANPQVAGQGLQQLREAGIEVISGVLQRQAEALNPGFIQRMRDGRPFVRAKMAISLDGRSAMASGESQWITSREARRDAQALRARSSAIVTGIGTVLADDPSMTVRSAELPEYMPHPDPLRQPLRVIVDNHLTMPTTAKMLSLPGKTLIFTATDDAETQQDLQAAGAEVVYLPNREGCVDFVLMYQDLAKREVNEVHLEAGANLAGAMLQARFIDELVIYMSPTLMGNNARGLFHLPHLEQLAQRVHLEIVDIRAVGQDWRITAKLLY